MPNNVASNKAVSLASTDLKIAKKGKSGGPLAFIENVGQVTDQYGKPRNDIQYQIKAASGLNIFIGDGAIHYQFSKAINQTSNEKSKSINEHQVQDYSMYRMDVELVGANKDAIVSAEQKLDYCENYVTSSTGESGATARTYTCITYKEVYPNIDWLFYVKGGKLKHEFVVRKGGNIQDIKLKYSGATKLKVIDGNLIASTPQGNITEAAPITYQQDGSHVESSFKVTDNILSYQIGKYEGALIIDPSLIWGTYFGGANEEIGFAVATDASANAYMCGRTSSLSGVATIGAFQTSFAGGTHDCIITKFDSTGNILWATYFGGNSIGGPDEESARSIKVSKSGAVYVCGYTTSISGIASPGAYISSFIGSGMGFIAKFGTNGNRIWSTYFGGGGDACGGLALDTLGNLYVTGSTTSTTGIASPGAYQTTLAGSDDAFVAKFDTSGSFQWATYLGGADADEGYAIAIDGSGDVVFSGHTTSTSAIASVGAYQTTYGGGLIDGFIAKFNKTGVFQWATYFGGGSVDQVWGIAADAANNVYVTGNTSSPSGIATAGAHQTTLLGTQDAFLAKFSGTGTIQWSTYFGGTSVDYGNSIALDDTANIYFSGPTTSVAGVATTGAFQTAFGGGTDAFIAEFNTSGAIQWATYYGGTNTERTQGIARDNISRNIYVTGLTYGTDGIATTGAYQTSNAGNYDAFLSQFNVCHLPTVSPITGAPPVICVGSTATLSVATYGGNWTSGNPGIASVSSTGTLTGVSTGVATISYTKFNGCGSTTVTAIVTVDPLPAPAPISGPTVVCEGANLTLSNASTGGVWSSGNTAVATVNVTGVVAGVSSGTVNISYTLTGSCGSASALYTVTVNPLPNAGLITGSSSLCVGSSAILSDAAPGGSWSSGNVSVAVISTSGVVTGVSAGTTAITYSVTNSCGTAYVINIETVNPLPAVSAISGSLSLCLGSSSLLTDATAAGTWSSASPSVAPVSSSGLVSAIAIGTSTISYSVTSAFGCTSIATTVVTVNAVPAGTIAPSGTVTICTSGYTTLSVTSGAGYTYQWRVGGAPIPGATNSTYTTATAGNYNVTITNTAGCSTNTTSTSVVVLPGFVVVPTISITATPGTTICPAGSVANFTTITTNGGSTPTYQWFINSTPVGTGVPTFSYVPANGDTVKCQFTSSNPCASPVIVMNYVVMTVNTMGTPSVSVVASPNDTVCSGDGVSYLPTVTYGGTSPTFLWTKNGVNVATGPTYYNSFPADGDVVVCKITSNHTCVFTTTASSTPIVTHVLAHLTNTLNVTASSTNISPGSSVTFTAVSPYATSFQWYINGTPVPGATNHIFITSSLADGNIVNCAAVTDKLCVLPATIISGGMSMQVSTGVNNIVETGLRVLPNPSKGYVLVDGNARDKVTIEITDILGHTIYTGSANPINGNVSHRIELNTALSNGLYLVRLTSENESVVLQIILDR